MSLAVIATIKVEPGHMEPVLRSLRAHRERCLANEPGTLTFEPMLARDLPDTIMLYEVYTDQAAFDAHWAGASLAQYRAETGERAVIASGVWGTPVAD